MSEHPFAAIDWKRIHAALLYALTHGGNLPPGFMRDAPARRTEQDGGIPNDAITPADLRAAHRPTDTTGETS